jgi:hypothetical protein
MLSFYKKTGRHIIYLILFFPLFFINIKSSHDWGDDFAQYIKQAANIVEGKSQTETGYIVNPDHTMVGPPAFPVGFPLILSPVYMVFGNSIGAFNYFNTLLLCIIGILMIYFFRKSFDELTSVLLALVVIYNPWTLGFKCEILSDFLFTLLLLLTTIVYLKITDKNILLSILCGILAVLLSVTKNLGIVFLIAIVADSATKVIYWYRDNIGQLNMRSTIYNLGSIILTFSIVFVLFNYFLFPTGHITVDYYKSLYQYDGIKEVFLKNIAYYINTFQDFFHPPMALWDLLPLIIKAFALTFFILGLVNALLHKISFIEILFGGYVVALFIYPNSTQGFRYLFPVLPFIMFYIVKGLKSFTLSRHINQYILTMGIALLCLLSYRTGITRIMNSQQQILQGPQEPEAVEAFDYIKKNTKNNDTIVFIKPRALTLYTGRYSFTNHPAQDSTSLTKRINLLKSRYFLLTSDMDNSALRNYITKRKDGIMLKFKNSKFEFYLLNN